jgi:hypothetical protein
MKSNKLIVVTLFILVSMLIVIGCKYDVAQSPWEKPAVANAETPTITGVVPSEALPGVNSITIHGKDFNDSLAGNIVYFDSFIANIVSNTDSTITVLRPNVVTNSASIKVVSDGALLVAKYPNPYKVSPVLEKWGSFMENVELSVAAVDAADTLYVVATNSRKIYKITPSGDKSPLKINDTTETVLPWVPADMRFGPNGNLYITSAPAGSREIAMIDIKTRVATTRWRYLAQGRLAKYCDFGDNGFMYLGGGSDLYYLNLSTAPTGNPASYTVTSSGLYPTAGGNTILAMRVYKGYVYVSAIKGTNRGIWKHVINTNGTLGAGTLVLDWNTTKFGSSPIRDIKNFALSSDTSTILVQVRDTIEKVENLIIVKPQGIESVYRGIVRPYGVFFDWSKSTNYIYMIGGNTSPSEEWNVYRVDIGAKSASRQ